MSGRMKKSLWIGAIAVVLVLSLIAYRMRRQAGMSNRSTDPSESEGDVSFAGRADAFREAGLQAGLNFHMRFLSGEQGERFKINLYDHGSGLAVADYDGDGHEDVYFCNQLGENGLYRNRGDGTFEDTTRKACVALGDRVCVAAVFADYDNDGYPDLFITSVRGGNVLFHNERNGTFRDVTRQAGVAHVGHSQAAAFFDYDNDGKLDLFITNTAKWTMDSYDPVSHYFPGLDNFSTMIASPREYDILYHNNGDGTFTDVTEATGLKGRGWDGDVAVFDSDGDGWLDLFVTNMFGKSQLYHNNGGKTFTDVTSKRLGRVSFGATGVKAFDYNNDGRLDLLIVDMHSDMWLPPQEVPRKTRYDLMRKYAHITGALFDHSPLEAANETRLMESFNVDPETLIFGNTLFEKLPAGEYREVSDKAHLETWWPWGIATGDFDNDGYQDAFLPSGMGYPYEYWPNVLMMNNGDGTFTDRAAAAGIEPPPGGRYLPEKIGGRPAPRSSRCAAVADFDGDGRLDLVVNNFNDRAFYFRNRFPQKNWIGFRLTGTTYRQADRAKRTSRDAVGAVVTLHFGKEVMLRQVQAAGGYLAQSSRTLHFGLGTRDQVDRAEIHWPSGLVQVIDKPELNKLHPIEESAEAPGRQRNSDGLR